MNIPQIVKEERLKGKTNAEIAKIIGKSKDTVSRHLKNLGIKPQRVLYLEENARLAPLIIEDLKEGLLSIYAIAKKYNRSDYYIKSIAKKYNIKTKSREEHLDEVTIVKNNPFEDLTNPDVQYWLGMLAADGSICKNRIRLSLQEKDLGHIEKFKSFIGYDLKIGTTLKNNKYRGYHVHFRSKKVSDFLYNLGITPRKTFTIDYKGPLTIDFLRGVIDGDGYIRKNRREISISSASLIFINQLHDFIENTLEIECKIRNPENNNVYIAEVCGKAKVKKLIELLYTNAHTYLQRKYDICHAS